MIDCTLIGNRIDDSFYGVTSNTRNTIKENDIWAYFTDRNGLGDIIQKSNDNEAHLFEYRGDKRLSKYTHIQNNVETNNTTYYWDALGRRVAKEIKTPIQTFSNVFAHEGDQDKILLARNGLGQETLYIDGQEIDEHLAEINDLTVKPYIIDYLGTVYNSEATSNVKAIGAFGEILQVINSISIHSEPVTYAHTGRQYDLESKTIFNRFRQRFQDEDIFTAIDPKGFDGGTINLYDYVNNQPLMLRDPNGLDVVFVSFGAVFGGSESPSSNDGTINSLDYGIGFDFDTFTFFGFKTTGEGRIATGLFAGAGAAVGYFPGTREQFFGRGSETSANVGIGTATAGFSTIESSGETGFTFDLPVGFGLGGIGGVRNTNTVPLFGTNQPEANNGNPLFCRRQ
jgi:RHS repeat-associated protein